MTNQDTLTSKLGDLADEVRDVTGETSGMTIDEMTAALANYTPPASGDFDPADAILTGDGWAQVTAPLSFGGSLTAIDITQADVAKVTSVGTGNVNRTLQTFNAANANFTNKLTSISFYNNYYLQTADFSGCDLSGVHSISFYQCSRLQTVRLPDELAPLTSLSSTFNSCTSIRTLDADLSKWDVSNVTNMSSFMYMNGFNPNSNPINVSTWDTSKVTTMASAFAGWTGKITGLENFDLSSCTTVADMLSGYNPGAGETALDLHNWNTPVLTNTSRMFLYSYRSGANVYTGFTSVDVSFDKTHLTNINRMFAGGGNSYDHSNIKHIIWDRDSSSVIPLPSAATSMFAATDPVRAGTGYLYVPDALVSSYKTATNYSTIASQIKGLSELPSDLKTYYVITA